MRILKSKFLMIAVIAAISTTSFNDLLANDIPQSIFQQKIAGGGIIVMDDIIMAVTVNKPQDHIKTVVILNSLNEIVFQGNGCGSNQCSFDLSTVASGSYTAVVYTQQGDSFSAIIQL